MKVKVINHVLHIKENGKYRPFSAEELTDILLEAGAIIDIFSQSRSVNSPITHRCSRCGCTSCYPDEIASSPAYGT